MNTFESPTPSPTSNEVAQEIQALLQGMYAAGAMDEEGPRLQALLNRLLDGSITPATARREVQTIANNRQDYH